MSPHAETADVDVVIPLYNGERHIAEAMRSVLEQTRPPRTLTVVDDGSDDQGEARVKEVMASNTTATEIRYVQQQNAGPNAARNNGLLRGASTYVAFLDADDRWMPRKLELQLACFAQSKLEDLALVYCGAYAIDEAGRRMEGKVSLLPEPLRGHVFEELLEKNVITGGASAILIKRSIFDRTGLFDEQLLTSEDFDMWLRISQQASIDLVFEELVGLRYHAHNVTHNTMRMLQGMLQFNAKWFDHAWDKPAVMNYWGHLIALFVSRAADRRAAMAMVDSTFSKVQQRILFRRAFGSLRLYVMLKRVRALMSRSRR